MGDTYLDYRVPLWSPHCGCGTDPGVRGVGHKAGATKSQAQGANSWHLVEFIATQRTGRKINMPEKEVSLP